MPKTPQEILDELEKLAEQNKRDAEVVRAHIESQKAFLELTKRLADKNAAPELFETTDDSQVDNNKTIKGEVIKYLQKHRGRYMKSDEIKAAVAKLFPDKTETQVFNRVRDILSDGDEAIDRQPSKGRGNLYGAK